MPSKFAKIKPNIWRHRLRGFSSSAKLLGIFLMTNEFCVMLGIYNIPKVNMALGTGLTEAEVDQALAELIRNGFCDYDEESMFIWVKDMARTQVADNPNRKQLKGVANEITRIAFDDDCVFVGPFLERYCEIFNLPPDVNELGHST